MTGGGDRLEHVLLDLLAEALQVAQPVTFGHHLLAYVEMLGRDRGRFADCRVRLNRLPLGAAALAGTTFPIDREFVARELGFDGICENSLDAVSDRDFAIEFCSAGAKAYPMLRYPWADARASLLALAADRPELEAVQLTYTNPETGADAQNILGFYALMLRPGQSLRSRNALIGID